jgi:ATP-dependent Clp protease ATP-binding subunit ClpB
MKVDFTNTIVIMTSNVGSRWMKDLPPEQAYPHVMQEVDQTFRPEFLNRIDDIILFSSLTKQDLMKIVDIQLGHIRRLLAERQINLEYTDAVKAYLAEKGYDPVYGARPLKRAIQRELQDPLANAVLQGRFGEGSVIQVDVKDDALVFETGKS